MIQSILLSLCLLLSTGSIFSMSDHMGDESPSLCCGLGDMAYTVAKCLGARTDFIFLAQHDLPWLLRKKFELRDHVEDRDKYYVTFGRYINGQNVSVYCTPLHEAIQRANVETVKLLCSKGVDLHKKIKSFSELVEEDLTTESYPAIYISFFSADGTRDCATEIQDINTMCHKGLSALELAQRMATEAQDKIAERQQIADFLLAYEKRRD